MLPQLRADAVKRGVRDAHGNQVLQSLLQRLQRAARGASWRLVRAAAASGQAARAGHPEGSGPGHGACGLLRVSILPRTHARDFVRRWPSSTLKTFAHKAAGAAAGRAGGGIAGNLVRILPEGCQATLDQSNWPRPEILDWLQSAGNIDDEELLRTFNCGLGMLVIVAQEDGAKCQDILTRCGESNFLVGQIRSGPKDVIIN